MVHAACPGRQSSADDASVTVTYADGSVCHLLYTSFGPPSFSKERIEVYAGGNVGVLEDFRRLHLEQTGGVRKQRRALRADKGHEAEVRAFVEAVRLGGEMPIAVDSLIETTLTSLAAVSSVHRQQHVTLVELHLETANAPDTQDRGAVVAEFLRIQLLTCFRFEASDMRCEEPARRVLFVTNIPSPYQIDFFTALSQEPRLSVSVIFCSASEADRRFSVPQDLPFQGTVLASRRAPFSPKGLALRARVLRDPRGASSLRHGRAVGKLLHAGARLARRYFRRRGIPWLYWGENPRKKTASPWRQGVKEVYLRRFLKPAAGALGVGRLACETYRDLMPPGRPVHNIPYAPNLDPLLNPSPETRQAAARRRGDWSIDDPVVALFCGSLTRRKAPDALLEAFAQVAPAQPNLCLQFAGDGPMAAALGAGVERRGLAERVRFLGFLEGLDLRAAYLSSDLFVLPTRGHEGWGVVVQEAMAAGLPVLVSDRVGSGADLVHDGQTGHVFPADNTAALADQLCQLAQRPDCRRQMAARAQSNVLAYAHTAVARAMADGLLCETP